MFCKLKAGVVLIIMAMAIFSVTLPTTTAEAASRVGVVDFLYVVDHHPETPAANLTLKEAKEAFKKEYEEKSTGLDASQKRILDLQLGQAFEKKRQELLQTIVQKVTAATQKVAQEKDLDVVIDKKNWVCGGVDITQDVLNKITAEKQ